MITPGQRRILSILIRIANLPVLHGVKVNPPYCNWLLFFGQQFNALNNPVTQWRSEGLCRWGQFFKMPPSDIFTHLVINLLKHYKKRYKKILLPTLFVKNKNYPYMLPTTLPALRFSLQIRQCITWTECSCLITNISNY